MARAREKEFAHQQTWGERGRYYKNYEYKNSKYDEWTSPRYYETHKEMVDETRKERERKEALEARRVRLRKLLEEEEKSFQIELMVVTRDKWRAPKPDEVPLELLKDVNVGLKLAEEEKRRHEAETALYNQWRRNNPTLRDYERSLRSKELKLSWLDQQIEKRMQKEREEEECKRLLRERDKRLEELKEQEERLQREALEKKERLRKDLEQQMEEMAEKESQSERLKAEEDEIARNRSKLEELEEARKREEQRIKERERALFNLRHHKLKLKQKAQEVAEDLEREEELIVRLREAQLADAIEDERKKREWRQALEQFLDLVRDQRELERKRRKYLDFVFESETQRVFEKQNEIWEGERAAREQLLRDVLETVRKQLEIRAEASRRKQLEMLREREENLKRLEACNEELRRAREEEEEKKEEVRRELEEQVRNKKELRKTLKTLEQKNLDVELEKARKEEERLKAEIVKLQRKHEDAKRKITLPPPRKFY